MRKLLLAASVAALGWQVPSVLTPSPASAANADNPYGNVDHRNDAGNDTGDSRVDNLNANQLNGNYKGSLQPRAPSGAATAAPAQPGMPPPPGTTVR